MMGYLKMLDFSVSMIIRVEQRHINAGLKGYPNSCPVALAMGETFGLSVGVAIGWFTFRFPENHIPLGFEECILGDIEKVKTFIRRFDKGDLVSPFEFEFTPTESLINALNAHT